jgi:outer membrane autotransporter protein
MFGRATLRQRDGTSGISEHIDANLGGLYAVYHRPSTERLPWYVSGSAVYGRLWFDNSVPGYLGHGLEQEYRGHTSSVSLEAGVPLTIGRGWTITPHLQLAASRATHRDFLDALGADVAVKQGHACWTQLGAQIEKTLLRRNGRQLTLWASGAVVHEFSGGNKIEVAGEAATGRRIMDVYPIDTGLRFAWSERYSLQGSLGRVCGDERGYRGSVSLNVGW